MPTARRRPNPVRSDASQRALWRAARRFRVDMPGKEWCDMWHVHLAHREAAGDWLGQRRVMKALLHALGRARREMRAWQGPAQLFAIIDPGCLSSSAICVHTPNPNGTPYPLDFAHAREVTVSPPLLAGRIDLQWYRVLCDRSPEGRCSYVIAAR